MMKKEKKTLSKLSQQATCQPCRSQLILTQCSVALQSVSALKRLCCKHTSIGVDSSHLGMEPVISPLVKYSCATKAKLYLLHCPLDGTLDQMQADKLGRQSRQFVACMVANLKW